MINNRKLLRSTMQWPLTAHCWHSMNRRNRFCPMDIIESFNNLRVQGIYLQKRCKFKCGRLTWLNFGFEEGWTIFIYLVKQMVHYLYYRVINGMTKCNKPFQVCTYIWGGKVIKINYKFILGGKMVWRENCMLIHPFVMGTIDWFQL